MLPRNVTRHSPALALLFLALPYGWGALGKGHQSGGGEAYNVTRQQRAKLAQNGERGRIVTRAGAILPRPLQQPHRGARGVNC